MGHDGFVKDVIATWSLRSPVIVIFGDIVLEDFCLKNQWKYHCLTNDLGITDLELAEHLAHLHYTRYVLKRTPQISD